MLDSGDWTAIGTGALAMGTFVLAWVTVWTGARDRRRDDEKRAEDRARDDRLRQESLEQQEHAQFERLLTEALSAAKDLSAAKNRYEKYASMVMLVDAAWNAEETIFAPPPWMLDKTISNRMRLLRAMVRLVGHHFSEKPTDGRYLQLIFPAMQRLRAVLMPLRLGRDPDIAESATRLASAGESMSVSSDRKYEREWGQALTEFETLALERLDMRGEV
jgi:hypothetical protein